MARKTGAGIGRRIYAYDADFWSQFLERVSSALGYCHGPVHIALKGCADCRVVVAVRIVATLVDGIQQAVNLVQNGR